MDRWKKPTRNINYDGGKEKEIFVDVSEIF